jgi:pyruvate/2-oxoglutarate dehydrogenase complex dihydrolipoamide acyltransferase (E2) component
VRRIVAENGIIPTQVRGTGRGGRLTKADVIAHMADSDPGPAKPARFSRGARELVGQLGLDERLASRGLHLVQTIAADGSSRPVCKLCFEGWT